MKNAKIIAPLKKSYNLPKSIFLELNQNSTTKNKNDSDQDISPSKNCHICPWLDTRQCLNNIYSSKVTDSPKAKLKHNRQVSANIKLRTDRRQSNCSKNKENHENKTYVYHRLTLKVVQPTLELPTQLTEEHLIKPVTSHQYKKPVHQVKHSWADFQFNIKNKLKCTLPTILNCNPQMNKPKTAARESGLNYSKSSRKL